MKRSKFSLSHSRLFSCGMGSLVPCGMFEVLPGDSVQQATSMLVRTQPLVAPVMHPVHVRVHHWFVPFRLIWEDWEDFITGGPDGNDASEFPTISIDAGVGTLADYLGVPDTASAVSVSALPFRAYNLIWNEWYRDQDLQTELAISEASGVDSTTATTLQRVAWEKDYFTSARPWEQKGPSVTLPLGTEAPVVFEEEGATPGVRTLNRAAAVANANVGVNEAGTTDADLTAFADLSNASAVDINVLREALALQRFEEARARYGSRYTEYLRYLGVRSADARLQRPEYLGGGRQTIQFSEVLQTNYSGGGGPL